jgi:hypothetical protein
MLATLACNMVEKQAAGQGLQASIPLSPGMIDWQVADGQRQVFDLLDAGQIGVRLTAHAMMSPRMTISQVVGLGREMIQGRTCDFCSLRETCRYQDHYAKVTEAR